MNSLPRATRNSSPQAIETAYAGCLFRSRLEARWAVFLDHLAIDWDYEPEAFRLPNLPEGKDSYLPDFWLPQVRMYAEVKPAGPDRSKLDIPRGEIAKCVALAMVTDAPVLILDGMPRQTSFWAIQPTGAFKGLDYGLPWEWVDYVFDDWYVRKEGRLFASTGTPATEHREDEGPENAEAVNAARSARFDRGQTPARPHGR